TYMKGWVLIHMIRAMMHDDEKFRGMLRGLSRTFYHQSVTTQQFENYITIHSGIDLSKVFDQYLRTTKIPVLEYQLNGKILSYHFADCVPGFSMPLQTNWTKDKFITPKANWQKTDVDTSGIRDTLKVKPDYYLNLAKL